MENNNLLLKNRCASFWRGAISIFHAFEYQGLASAVSVLVVFMTLVTVSVHASSFNRCVDSEGNITFTDVPCDSDKQAGRIQLKSDGRTATVDSSESSAQGGHARNEPVFDTSSEASTIASRERVFATLSPERRDDLKAALMALLIVEMALHPDETKDGAISSMNKKINGKTASDIFAMADAIKTDPVAQRALRK